mmetsp:Transcript_25739/g.38030  ORF Transcript_25739/g.38030 Transcript_25739/m.38030 type:complete len:1052 (-) Transcript_25739:33-3188(-)
MFRSAAHALIVLCAVALSNWVVVARPQFLDDFSVEEVTDWLTEHNLGTAFAETFEELQYDGDVLANFLKPHEVSLTDFPGATRAHLGKLFDRIGKFSRAGVAARRLEEDSANVQSGRRLSKSSGTQSAASGIRILHNNSVISMGETGDVELVRAGPDRLATEDELYVQGVDVVRAAEGLSGGGVAWDFSHPASRHFLRSDTNFQFPAHFTIEMWVYPKTNAAGKYFMSFAAHDNFNCLLLQASGFKTYNDWHHVVVTYDRHALTVHDNGDVNMRLLYSEFCGTYNGTLVFGQEQDSLGGGFQWSQGTPMLLDTVAIYNRAFDETERGNKGKTCVDMKDSTLVTLWTGYTRGADQVGTNQAEVYFDGFVPGAVGNLSCSNAGVGEGEPGPSYDSYTITDATPAVGAVGWVFPGGNTDHHLMVEDFVLPLDFTIETWIYPLNVTSGTYFISWATENNFNCFITKAWSWEKPYEWYHIVVTWDGVSALTYVNGILDESIRYGEFCGEYSGSLSVGQEQDSVGGTFDANQAPPMIVDTVAVYSRAWSGDQITTDVGSPCVDLATPELYALYTGYSRGKDLIGGQDGTLSVSEILSPGQALTDGDSYTWFKDDVIFDLEACEQAQAESTAHPPDFDNSLVGGVGWDFTGDGTEYYLMTASDFELPLEFTIEFWFYPRSTAGYVMSWASTFNQNCLLVQNVKAAVNEWHHIVVVVEKNGFYDYTTTVYVNGTADSGFLWGGFCGNHTGSLAFAQEQDSVGGSFDATQATNAIIDTVAIYNTAWSSDRVGTDRAVGVDLKATDLYALYSGFTRGKDLIGTNDAVMWLYQFADGMTNPDASASTLEMISPATVGGVAWDFPTGQTEYFLQTSSITLPTTGFTIEMWVTLNSLDTTGYFVSYAATSSDNCLLLTMAGFDSSDIGVWRHFVVTYDPDADQTYTYLDGVNDQNFIAGAFCGDTGPGALAIAQEQDAIGGSYELGDEADIVIDTVAIYNTYWSSDEVNAREGNCVNLHDPALTTVWSGFTRGKDLVGNNDAEMNIYGWEEGASLTCDDYNLGS